MQFERPLGDEQAKDYGEPTKTLFPGETGQTTVDLAPGKYRLVCTIANHDNLGQYAELKVARARGCLLGVRAAGSLASATGLRRSRTTARRAAESGASAARTQHDGGKPGADQVAAVARRSV